MFKKSLIVSIVLLGLLSLNTIIYANDESSKNQNSLLIQGKLEGDTVVYNIPDNAPQNIVLDGKAIIEGLMNKEAWMGPKWTPGDSKEIKYKIVSNNEFKYIKTEFFNNDQRNNLDEMYYTSYGDIGTPKSDNAIPKRILNNVLVDLYGRKDITEGDLQDANICNQIVEYNNKNVENQIMHNHQLDTCNTGYLDTILHYYNKTINPTDQITSLNEITDLDFYKQISQLENTNTNVMVLETNPEVQGFAQKYFYNVLLSKYFNKIETPWMNYNIEESLSPLYVPQMEDAQYYVENLFGLRLSGGLTKNEYKNTVIMKNLNMKIYLENLKPFVNTPPEIKANDLELWVGDQFNEFEHPTAFDLEDQDITHKLMVSHNEVDTTKAGKYLVTYHVTDSHGAKTEKSIFVTVKDKAPSPTPTPTIAPSQSPTIVPTNIPSSTPTSKPITNPKTNDETNIQMYVMVFSGAIMIIGGFVLLKKQSKKTK